jgi:hypothetical protein
VKRSASPAVPVGVRRLQRPATAAVLAGLLVVNLAWACPDYNWDMLPYIAAGYQLGGMTPESAHELTYRQVRETVSPAAYQRLTESSAYRQVVTQDHVAFTQQLPFYRMKLVYPSLLMLSHRAGINPVFASVVISRIAYLAIGLVVLLWLSSFLSPLASLVSTWATMSISFMVTLAQLSTPDSLSTFVVLLAMWLVFQKGRLRAGLAILLLSILIRPDNLVWLAALAGYQAITNRARRSLAITAMAVGAVLAVSLVFWSGSHDWVTFFHHRFIERIDYPETFEPTLSPFGYLRLYLRETHPANLPSFAMLFGLLAGWLVVVRVKRLGWADRQVQLLLVLGAFAGMHWLLYPDGDRFFVAAYLVTVIVFLRHLTQREAVVFT